MNKLLSVKAIADRYECSEKTARRYMRRMDHMEKPLRVTEEAVMAWEMSRTLEPDIDNSPLIAKVTGPNLRKGTMYVTGQNLRKGSMYISRVRPKGARA